MIEGASDIYDAVTENWSDFRRYFFKGYESVPVELNTVQTGFNCIHVWVNISEPPTYKEAKLCKQYTQAQLNAWHDTLTMRKFLRGGEQ